MKTPHSRPILTDRRQPLATTCSYQVQKIQACEVLKSDSSPSYSFIPPEATAQVPKDLSVISSIN